VNANSPDSGPRLTNLLVTEPHDPSNDSLPPRVSQARVAVIEFGLSHSLEEVVTLALDEVCRLVGSPIGFYHLVDEGTGALQPAQWSTRALEEFRRAEAKGEHYGIDQAGFWADAVRWRKAPLSIDFELQSQQEGQPHGQPQAVRELVVPVRRQDRVVAVMGVANKTKAYTDADVMVVTFLADVAWNIVSLKRTERDREHALQAASQRTAQLTALLEGSKNVLRGGDYHAVARSLFDTTRELTGAAVGFVSLLNVDADSSAVIFYETGEHACTVAPSVPTRVCGLRAEAYRTAHVVVDDDFPRGPSAALLPEGHVALQNALVAPLTADGKTIGVMGIGNKPGGFTADDRRIAEGFADLVALALLRERQSQEVQSYQAKLRQMTFDATLTEERERRRIAVDLHDRIGQSLALAQIKLSGARDGLDGEARAVVSDAIDLVAQSLADTRTLTFELAPPVLYELEMKDAIGWLVEDVETRFGMRISLRDDGAAVRLDEASAGLVFRAVRELLINVFKHAKTRTASVSLHSADGLLHVEVEDEGGGFDMEDVRQRSRASGFGLFSVQEQLGHVGGGLEVLSVRGRGTCVSLRIPLTPRPLPT
jgi:signal transduction histidine kinase